MIHSALALAAVRRVCNARRRDALGFAHISALASCRANASSATETTKTDPEALSAEMVTYARRAWRSGDRATAAGVLEHGADLITRAVEGQAALALAAHVAKARTKLAWAAMQSDSGELAHAHRTTVEACASVDKSGHEFVSDAVVAHVAAAINAARCHRSNAISTAPDPEGTFATPWDVMALEDHLEDAASAALLAECVGSHGKDLGDTETGPGLERCHSVSLDTKYKDVPQHADAVALRIAMLGGRCAAASALGDADAACDAACDIHTQLEHNEWASEKGWTLVKQSAARGPHGAAVASALKFAAHWTTLRGAGCVGVDDDKYALASRTYDRALAVAKTVAESTEHSAATAALCADEIVADVCLAKAQLALRVAVAAFEDKRGDHDFDYLALAETAAAAAVTAAESLRYPNGNHPRVGLAIAASADVYVAKAVLAAKGKGGVGDGAGVLFADGLYRNALHKFGTARPPTAVASDADAAAGGAASGHLRLVAALVHAKYAAVLRASGTNRFSEAELWETAAVNEWRHDFFCTGEERRGDNETTVSVIQHAARGIGSVGKLCVVLDGELMMPVVG